MIKNHPSLEQLRAYVDGTLGSCDSLVIAAHCDMCEKCQAEVAQLTEVLASESLSLKNELSDQPRYSSMIESILQLPELPQENAIVENVSIELDGREFVLPPSLRRYASVTGSWSKLVGKLWQAPVNIGGTGKANFIFMEKGGSVPEHTHKGRETTLVINGEFSDGMNTYKSGDFIYLNDTHTHSPLSNHEDGCLVFSIIDEPLHFTSGVARLLNPFSHLFF
ncbi:cupin domain-containing protein [Alteromonas sp. 5E99-2]|uniref:ChrR family anti-sigma-E factor n=1 Tax=Alteromonas sp. 5E99-2 TaxID=2817683 RepID=UPI001A97E26E|nr:ChrR family anti-sigma-E factor [Alteromonas sp. 5E99-2]MBO1255267.1 cupin domain-containing protein [Alteromonas sp. 5E99-2]